MRMPEGGSQLMSGGGWGMDDDGFKKFLMLVLVGMKRLSSRQRFDLLRCVRAWRKTLNVSHPQGQTESEIQAELERARMAAMAKPTLILPRDVK